MFGEEYNMQFLIIQLSSSTLVITNPFLLFTDYAFRPVLIPN
jgi:flagellar assembly factor FliW